MNSNVPQNKIKVVAGYALQQRLGSGSFAVVYKGARLSSSGNNKGPETVAIKAISRTSEKLTKKVLQNLEIEISILRTYQHANIVCMYQVQKTERHFYLLLEYCAGGDVQGLIRSRAAGRLSERLTRRLMRDLKAGLQFLWGQELIHRDIKPQNLLLTGPLPFDEGDDPAQTPAMEQERRDANFPSEQFCLKIADFGFARHLQSQSLAETLCGSPIYMAPEILQHQRYDAKADLWSVGTVLFEMISGKPPFHGENHIDLLKNIKMKAVRLPPDVRVSNECVTLLRLLLNRNPLSRAGFKEFFEATDQLVALGCNGATIHDPGSCRPMAGDLETIPENDGRTVPDADADETVDLHCLTAATSIPQSAGMGKKEKATVFVTPTFSPVQPSAPIVVPQGRYYSAQRTLAPLVPSPPSTGNCLPISQGAPEPPILDLSAARSHATPMQEMDTYRSHGINSILQSSTDDNSYVMVEHGSIATTKASTVSWKDTSYRPVMVGNSPIIGSRREYATIRQARGMLSTSPGTGGTLMGMFSGGRTRLIGGGDLHDTKRIETQTQDTAKMLATAEDIGRRAITVAHVGDNRAFLALRLIALNESMLSATAMEGIEEDPRDYDCGNVTDDSSATDAMTVTRRRRSSSMSDKSMEKADEAEEMPFAVHTDPVPSLESAMPTRRSSNSSITGSKVVKPTPSSIRSHFSDALLCYLKALTMLKGAVSAVAKVSQELEDLQKQRIIASHANQLQHLKKRFELTSDWLSSQFRGVLDRADATNSEIAKLHMSPNEQRPASVNVEELIYNHAMTCGREGAVKQLLGQLENARSCYRSAGLLIETLLMEQRIEGDDKKVLENYVDGFAARINELDQSMLQHSRLSTGGSSRRSPGVVSLIGQDTC